MTSALSLALFLSGFTGLVLEQLWFRQAGLALGNSVWASTLVLAAFMVGTAFGNALAARVGRRVTRPLRVYAAAEVIIGLFGVMLVVLWPALGGWLAPRLAPLLDTPWAINAVRLGLAFLVLVVPATAMGITLPLVTRALTSRRTAFGPALARLYGSNTLGAVTGVLTAEFVLVGRVGLVGTATTALAITVAVALVALWLDRQLGPIAEHETPVPPAPTSTADASVAAEPLPRWTWPAAGFLTGFVLLALESLWFRLLLLAVIGYSETFAVMLAVVLAGVGLGAFAGEAWLRLRTAARPEALAAPLALAAGAVTVLTYWVFLRALPNVETLLVEDTRTLLPLAIPLMLPTSILSGAFFTLAGAAFRTQVRGDAEAAGWFTFANAAGSALGPVVAGFVFIPLLGLEQTLFVLTLVYGVAGGWILLNDAALRGRVATGAVVLFVGGLLAFPYNQLGAELRTFPAVRYKHLHPNSNLISARVSDVREGVTDTLFYLESIQAGQVRSRALFLNATPMADTDWVSRRYMKLFVYLPAALHPHLEKALVIAYGVGNTTRALVDTPGMRQVDVVDISRDVLRMSPVVHGDRDPLTDPRVRTHAEDGRFFLQAAPERYDLITSEPPPPRASGVVNLYTREYFTLLRSRLNDGGMVAYWLPIHAVYEQGTKGVLRAFCDAFDDCSLWHGIGGELILLGTRDAAGPVSTASFLRQWNTPIVAAEMNKLGLERPEQLGALFIGDAPFLRALCADTPPVSDNWPARINAGHPDDGRSAFGTTLMDADGARTRFQSSPLIARLFPPDVRDATVPSFEIQRIITQFSVQGTIAISDVHVLLELTKLKTPVLWLMGSDADAQDVLEKIPPAELGRPAQLFHLGVRLMSERAYAAAAATFSRVEPDPVLGTTARGFRAYALALTGHPELAREIVTKMASTSDPDHDDVHMGEGMNLPPFWNWMNRQFHLLDSKAD